jgi:hypothetical protein
MRRLKDDATVDGHAPVANLPLHLRPRNAGVQGSQEQVEALSFVFRVDRLCELVHWVRNSFVRARSVPYNTAVVSPEG